MNKKQELKKIERKIMSCKKCRLHKTRHKAVPGEGIINPKYMFVGIAPGKEEDLTGKPFIGKSGKFLDFLLKQNNIDRSKCFITSVIKCHPPKNRMPKQEEINACLRYLIKQIEIVNPDIIVCLGKLPEKVIKNLKLKTKIFYTYHPSAGMRFPKIKEKMIKDFKKLKELDPGSQY